MREKKQINLACKKRERESNDHHFEFIAIEFNIFVIIEDRFRMILYVGMSLAR